METDIEDGGKKGLEKEKTAVQNEMKVILVSNVKEKKTERREKQIR